MKNYEDFCNWVESVYDSKLDGLDTFDKMWLAYSEAIGDQAIIVEVVDSMMEIVEDDTATLEEVRAALATMKEAVKK